MNVSLLTSETVKTIVATIEENGGYATLEADAGTIIGYDTERVECFRAIQKFKDGPWICRHINTQCFQWEAS